MPDRGDDGSGGKPPPSLMALVEDAYRSHADLLREIAEKKFRVPAGDAEGIVNEIFTAYLMRAALVRDAKSWLVGAVCHASRGYWRARSRTEPLPPDINDRADPLNSDPEKRLIEKLTVALALNRLGPKCRTTLRMYYAEGYSAAEIAKCLGTTPGYVMQLLHTCRKRARELYRDLTGEGHE